MVTEIDPKQLELMQAVINAAAKVWANDIGTEALKKPLENLGRYLASKREINGPA